MPRVRNMDRSVGDAQPLGWIAPPSLPVREHAQVQHRGEDRPWPFLYSYREDGSVTENRGRKKTSYEEATEVGEALV